MSRLIALYSPAPRCGKTTIALHLRDNHGFIHLDFNELVEKMVRNLLEETCQDAAYAQSVERAACMMSQRFTQTELPYHPTPAHLIRTLKTEWGEQCMGPQFWSELWRRRVKPFLDSDKPVVCADLRTPAQLVAVKSLGGEYWRITRPGHVAMPGMDYRSLDGALDGLPILWHNIIPNDGTEEMLLQYVDAVMKMEVVS